MMDILNEMLSLASRRAGAAWPDRFDDDRARRIREARREEDRRYLRYRAGRSE